jgi:hypothetical protein
VDSRAASEALVRDIALPGQTGTAWAPDRLSVWPLGGGRYGIDAHYRGETGRERAAEQQRRLAVAGLSAGVRHDGHEACVLRVGPLAHGAVWPALEAFLGRRPA